MSPNLVLDYLVRGPWRDPPATIFRSPGQFRSGGDASGVDRRRQLPSRRRVRAGRGCARGCGSVGKTLTGFRAARRRLGAARRALRRFQSQTRHRILAFADLAAALAGLAGICRGRRPDRPVAARRCRRATASPRSSSPSSAGCIRSAFCFAGLLLALSYHRRRGRADRACIAADLTLVFQGVLLFYVLASDMLDRLPLRLRPPAAPDSVTQ